MFLVAGISWDDFTMWHALYIRFFIFGYALHHLHAHFLFGLFLLQFYYMCGPCDFHFLGNILLIICAQDLQTAPLVINTHIWRFNNQPCRSFLCLDLLWGWLYLLCLIRLQNDFYIYIGFHIFQFIKSFNMLMFILIGALYGHHFSFRYDLVWVIFPPCNCVNPNALILA